METYKKPVVASKRKASSFIMIDGPSPVAFIARKVLGDDDFHPENSRALTTRKDFSST